MRWRETQEGDRRIKTYFAWLPTWNPTKKGWIWLEWVTMEQVYDWSGITKPRTVWINVKEVKHEQPNVSN